MKVNLSSNTSTFYRKIFIPIIFLIFFMLSLFEKDLDFTFYIVVLIFSFFIFYNAYRLKFVKGDDNFLYIKNFTKEIKIPLENLLEVNESRFFNRVIKIEFKQETKFGKKIVFIPYSKWFLFDTDHPVTKELQAYINKHNI